MQLPALCSTLRFGASLTFFNKFVWERCRRQRTKSAITCSREAWRSMITHTLSDEIASAAQEILIEAFGPDMVDTKYVPSRSRASSLVQQKMEALSSARLVCEEHEPGQEQGRSSGARCNSPTEAPCVPRPTVKLDQVRVGESLASKDLIDCKDLRVLKPKVCGWLASWTAHLRHPVTW